MIKSGLYPIAIKTIQERPNLLKTLFLKLRPHQGAFIGVCELQGCFLCESKGELYSSLEIGEQLCLAYEAPGKKKGCSPISVKRKSGTVIGELPFSDSIVPNMLINRGIAVTCYLEAKEFNAGLLALGVSIYCENY